LKHRIRTLILNHGEINEYHARRKEKRVPFFLFQCPNICSPSKHMLKGFGFLSLPLRQPKSIADSPIF
jgi:hypothetical protein